MMGVGVWCGCGCARYLAGGEGGLLGVARELAGLRGEALEDVVDEGVEDGDAALGDARVGVHLLEHLWGGGGWWARGKGKDETTTRQGRAKRGRATTCLVDVGAVALRAGLLAAACGWQ